MTCVLVTQGIKVGTTCLSAPLILLDKLIFHAYKHKWGNVSYHRTNSIKISHLFTRLPFLPFLVM